MQAWGGLMSIIGDADSEPTRVGNVVSDMLSGMNVFQGALLALRDRDRTGAGIEVEVSLLDSLIAFQAPAFAEFLTTGRPPPRTGNRQAGLSTAPYNVYPTADGHVAIHIVTEGHWKNLTVAMEREDLQTDPRFATNADRIQHMDEIDAEVAAWTRTLGKMEVFARTKRLRIGPRRVRPAARAREQRRRDSTNDAPLSPPGDSSPPASSSSDGSKPS